MAISGFDIGGTKVLSACLVDEDIILEQKDPTPESFEEMIALIGERLSAHERDQTIDAVGIGVAGAFDDEGKLWCPNVPAVSGKPFVERLEKEYGKKIVIENDGQAALRGEIWRGALKDHKNAALISIGTGIGAAFVVDGRILGGKHGVFGSSGWIITRDVDGKLCHYEELASGTALNRLASEIGLNSRELIRAYRNGDQEAKNCFSLWAGYLSEGVATITSLFDVDTIAIGGGISNEFDLFEDEIKNKIENYASPLMRNTKVIKASLGDKACLYGALSLAQKNTSR